RLRAVCRNRRGGTDRVDAIALDANGPSLMNGVAVKDARGPEDRGFASDRRPPAAALGGADQRRECGKTYDKNVATIHAGIIDSQSSNRRFSDSQILRFSDSQILRFSDSQILKSSDSQILTSSNPQIPFSPCTILLMPKPAGVDSLTGLASRFSAFIAERHPFALAEADDALDAVVSGRSM